MAVNAAKDPQPGRALQELLKFALIELELSPCESAVCFTDDASDFSSEASVYRLPKTRDLITGLASMVVKAADEIKDRKASRTSSERLTSPPLQSLVSVASLNSLLDENRVQFYLSTNFHGFSSSVVAGNSR